ncbi:cytochrome c family protein [bacterium]|nr:cytochrome c family protein [bacterium]
MSTENPQFKPLDIRPGYARLKADENAGSKVCKDCHSSIYQQWLTTPHAIVRDTEMAENPPHKGSCRRCHGQIEQFIGCEACHGPRAMHASNPEKSVPQDCVICSVQKYCIQCHNRSIDPDFNAADSWEMVDHGKN